MLEKKRNLDDEAELLKDSNLEKISTLNVIEVSSNNLIELNYRYSPFILEKKEIKNFSR